MNNTNYPVDYDGDDINGINVYNFDINNINDVYDRDTLGKQRRYWINNYLNGHQNNNNPTSYKYKGSELTCAILIDSLMNVTKDLGSLMFYDSRINTQQIIKIMQNAWKQFLAPDFVSKCVIEYPNTNEKLQLHYPLTEYPLIDSDTRSCKISSKKMLMIKNIDMTQFEIFLKVNDIPEPCQCIKNDVEDCFDDYYKNKQMYSYQKTKKEHHGIKNIINLYFRLTDIMTYDGLIALCDIVICIKHRLKYSLILNEYLKKRFNISRSEAHVIYAYLDMMNFVEHDTTLCCPNIMDNAVNFLKEHCDLSMVLEPLIIKRLVHRTYINYLPSRWVKYDKINDKKTIIDLITSSIDFDNIENSSLFLSLVENHVNNFYLNDVNIEIDVYMINENEDNNNDTNRKLAVYTINKNKNNSYIVVANPSKTLSKNIYVDMDGRFFDGSKIKLQCVV